MAGRRAAANSWRAGRRFGVQIVRVPWLMCWACAGSVWLSMLALFALLVSHRSPCWRV